MNTCKRIGAGASLGISSIYLTWLVDQVTLSTWLQRGFIFLYFMAMSFVLLMIRKGRSEKQGRKLSSSAYLVSVSCAAVCSLLFEDILLPQADFGAGQAVPGWMSAVLFLGALLILAFFFSWMGELYLSAEQKRTSQKGPYTPPSKRKICAVCVASLLIVSAVFVKQVNQHPSLWINKEDSSVTFVNEGKDPESGSGEVWFQVLENGRKIAPEKIFIPQEESGWTIRDGYFLSATPGSVMTIPVKIPSDMEFSFMSHSWTGSVSIQWEDQWEIYDFFSEGSSVVTLEAPWTGFIEVTYDWFQIVLYLACGVFVWLMLLWFLLKNHNMSWFVLFGISWVAVIESAFYVGQMNVTFALLLGVSMCTAFWLYTRPAIMERYFCTPAMVAMFLLSVYFTFALAGNDLFMKGVRMDLSGNTISCFVLLAVALCPILYAMLALFEFAIAKSKKLEPQRDRKKIFRAGVILFFLFAGIELVFSLGFYPANMSPDSVDHWLQAIGYWDLENGHPVIFPLFIRLLSKIALTPYVYIVFQILFCAFVISKWLLFLYEKGVSLKALILFTVFMALLPSNNLTLTLLSKNPIFAILNLWVLMQLVRLFDDPGRCVRGIWWNVETAISLAFLFLVRRNGFLAVYVAAAVIIMMTCFRLKLVKWKTLPSLAGALVIVLLVQGPLYSNYTIIKRASGARQPPLTTLYSRILVSQVEVPEDIKETMETILPEEEYYARFNPYNADIMAATKPRPNYGDMSTKEGLSIYLRLLLRYPDIVIEDRLQATDLCWNILNNQDSRAWNHRYIAGIHISMPQECLPQFLKGTEAGSADLYFKPNAISKLLSSFSTFIEGKPLLDAFVWRNGIYIVWFLAFAITLGAHRRLSRIWIFMPNIATLVTLVLLIGWQIYHYIYFFPMATVAFISCGCVMLAKDEKIKTEKDG